MEIREVFFKSLPLLAAACVPMLGFAAQNTDREQLTKNESPNQMLASIRFHIYGGGGPCYYRPCYPCFNPYFDPYYYPYYPYYPRYGLGIRVGCGC